MIALLLIQMFFSVSSLTVSPTVNRLSRNIHYMSNSDIQTWKSGFQTCKKELCVEIEGSIPSDLNGTFFRNGYSKFEVGQESLVPLDGDGMVAAVTFQDGKATFRNRFVNSKSYKIERNRRSIAIRGVFGTSITGGMFSNLLNARIKNPSNTNVIYWAGRLLALWQGGRPHLLEGDSLRTVEEYKLRNAKLTGLDACFAYPKVDADKNRIVFVTKSNTKVKGVPLKIYEYDNNFNPISTRSVDIPGFIYMNDYVVTANHYIFHIESLKCDPTPFVLGAKSLIECVTADTSAPSPSTLYIVPRDENKPVITIPMKDASLIYNVINGYEEKDTGKIIFDVIQGNDRGLECAKNYMQSAGGQAVRYTLTPSASSYSASTTNMAPEIRLGMPTINPAVSAKQHRYIWSLSAASSSTSPLQGLICIDTMTNTIVDSWTGGSGEYVGHCSFAAKSSSSGSSSGDERDGYLLSYLYNGNTKKTSLVIFDASNISKGPIHTLEIPIFLPHYLYSSYAKDLIYNKDDILRRFTASLGIDSKSWNEMNGGFSGLGISYDF